MHIDPDDFVEDARQVFRDAATSFSEALNIAKNPGERSITDSSEHVTEGIYTVFFL